MAPASLGQNKIVFTLLELELEELTLVFKLLTVVRRRKYNLMEKNLNLGWKNDQKKKSLQNRVGETMVVKANQRKTVAKKTEKCWRSRAAGPRLFVISSARLLSATRPNYFHKYLRCRRIILYSNMITKQSGIFRLQQRYDLLQFIAVLNMRRRRRRELV